MSFKKLINFFESLLREENFKVIIIFLLAIILGGFVSFEVLGNKFLPYKPAPGGVLKEGLIGKVYTLNPLLANNEVEKAITETIYDGLVRINYQGEIEYELAEDISLNEDRLTYFVNLKDNLKWHDGKLLTADDVVFTFQKLKNIDKSFWGLVKIEKIDNDTVSFKLPQPSNYFLDYLSQIKIIPRHIWNKIPQDQWGQVKDPKLLIGSGPFVIQKIEQKNENLIINLTKNQNYFEPVMLAEIVFKVYPSQDQAYYDLLSKEINALGGLNPQLAKNFNSRKSKLIRIILPRYYALFLNQKALKNSSALKEFIEQRVNRFVILERVFQKEALALESPFNLAKTKIIKKKTQASPLPSQEQLTLLVPDNLVMKEIAEELVKMLAPLKVEIQIKESDEIKNLIKKGNYQAVLFGTNFGWHPDFYIFWHSSQFPPDGLNFTFFINKKLDKILEDLKVKDLTEEQYKEKLKEVNKILQEDAPVVFLANPYYLYFVPKETNLPNFMKINSPWERFSKINIVSIKKKLF